MSDNNQDYYRTIIVEAPPAKSYEFLTSRIGDWWTAPENSAESIGSEPTFRFGEAFWKMKVTNLIENKLVRWKCIVANHIDNNLPVEYVKEWEGTEIEFTIDKYEEGSKISLKHYGLNNSLNCFDICVLGWDHYFVGVLSNVLEKQEL